MKPNQCSNPSFLRRTLWRCFGLVVAVGAAVQALAAPNVMNLRYEWATSVNGPWTAVPSTSLSVHSDGSATAESGGAQRHFRLRIGDASAPDGGSGTVPVLPLSAIPSALLEHLKAFVVSVGEEDDEGAADWKSVEFAPFATPVCSAWSENGVPDLVEIKVVGLPAPPRDGRIFPDGEGTSLPRDRGFIVASLTREDVPLLEFSTQGRTPVEELLERSRGGTVKCIRRFGPMFTVAEDGNGNPLANLGLQPILLKEEDYAKSGTPVSWDWDSERASNPSFPEGLKPSAPLAYGSYREFKQRFVESEFLRKRRTQRKIFAEFDWLALEGKEPVLELELRGTKVFLAEQRFASFRLDDEDVLDHGAFVMLLPDGGVRITGNVVGAYRLTLTSVSGEAQRQLVVVKPAAGAFFSAAAAGQTGVFTRSRTWNAGTWADQPRYDQRADLGQWCEAVGCGPVALAMQVTWLEKQKNVPSAFWSRLSGITQTQRLDSLRTIDAPAAYNKNDGNSLNMRMWYDYWHEQCDVICEVVSGAGATTPSDLGEALFGYASFVSGILFPATMGTPGTPLVGASAHWEADGISDDWDESGVLLANTIKAGRPGTAYYMELWHYCNPFAYKKTVKEIKVNGIVINSYTYRSFRCNMGWGNTDKWLNAYDVDGCYLLNLWQKRIP